MTGYKSLVMAAVAGLATLAGGSRADAFFFGHSHGSHGSSGGSWGGSWGSHGSWGGGWGSHGSWGGGWGSHGSHGSYGGSAGYGSYGSGGGYAYGSHGSHGSSGGYSTHYAPSYDSAPRSAPTNGGMNPPAPPADGAAPLPSPNGSTRISRDSAMLAVHVPAEAKVFVNDLATRSTGADRRYMSRGLANGREYTYTVRAEIERDGKLLTESKTVKLQGGAMSDVSFTFENAQEVIAAKPLRTALILNVPADAKVFLAGKETTTKGAVREFATTKLAAGDAWKDYTVRVEIERSGRTLTKEETISVAAGESRELVFNFDAPEVASVTADAGL